MRKINIILLLTLFPIFACCQNTKTEIQSQNISEPNTEYKINQENLNSNKTIDCVPGGFCSNQRALEYLEKVYYRYEVELIDYFINENQRQIWLYKIYSKGDKGTFFKVFQLQKTRISGFNKDGEISEWIEVK